MEALDIGIVCKNFKHSYEKGKLMLANNFVVEYGASLPEKLYFEVPSGDIWCGKYVKGRYYVEGLEKMMDFYGLRPYNLVLICYSGGPNFFLQIFNECAVEIVYPFACPLTKRPRLNRQNPYLCKDNCVKSDVEIDKLASTLSFNAMSNFKGLCDVIISSKDMVLDSKYQVLSDRECMRMNLSEEMTHLELCFENYYWTVKLNWKNGQLYFDHVWYEFVKSSKLCQGDVCTFILTPGYQRYQVAVLSKNLVSQLSVDADSAVVHQCFNWFKIVNESVLLTGKLEIPQLFRMKFRTELPKELTLEMPDGTVFKAKYSSSENSLYRLKEMFTKYSVYMDCVLFFEYVAPSKLNVSIYDSLGYDLLKDITGEFISDILKELEYHTNEMLDAVEEINQGLNNSLINLDKDEHIILNVQEIAGNDLVPCFGTFAVKLKSSHVDQKTHGVYCPTRFYETYKEWTTGTEITLQFEGVPWTVEVKRLNNSCRFGRGWNSFISDNNLEMDDELEFKFVGDKTIEVIKLV